VKHLPTVLALLLAALLFCPAEAPACSVCFGDKGSQANLAAGQSILFLLAVVMAVLASMIAFFVLLARRASRAPLSDEEVMQMIQTAEPRPRPL
jgi:uncharacterized membrane protein